MRDSGFANVTRWVDFVLNFTFCGEIWVGSVMGRRDAGRWVLELIARGDAMWVLNWVVVTSEMQLR